LDSARPAPVADRILAVGDELIKEAADRPLGETALGLHGGNSFT
jgi:hypothetical protein